MGAFDYLKWTCDGAFEQLFGPSRDFNKNSNAWGVARGDVEASIWLVHNQDFKYVKSLLQSVWKWTLLITAMKLFIFLFIMILFLLKNGHYAGIMLNAPTI